VNVAIVHYHLNRGGVTQVIINHLRAIASLEAAVKPKIALLYDGQAEGWPENLEAQLSELDFCRHVIPSLAYDQRQKSTPERLAEDLHQSLASLGFSPDATVLHVHNHALGKNTSLPVALGELARCGYGQLLQIHDFAEDFRPANYTQLIERIGSADAGQLAATIYPQTSQIHYAVLNGRDFNVLRKAGVAESRLHNLPNPVVPASKLPDKRLAREKLERVCGISVDDLLLIYPVRGIRRKNIGEAVLWSVFGAPATKVGLTLPPLNPVEKHSYNRWTEFCAALNLPIVFELGTIGIEFTENLAAADAILTTSVAEGFGMVFLEAWLAGRPLMGRDLPEITADFVAAGVEFPQLEPQFWVPVEWVGRDDFHATLTSAYHEARTAYRQPEPPAREVNAKIEALIDADRIDFGLLNLKLQQRVIEKTHRESVARDRLRELNAERSSHLGDVDSTSDVIAANAAVVRREYSLEVSGRRLMDTYANVSNSPRSSHIEGPAHGERILGEFLDVGRLHPVRLET